MKKIICFAVTLLLASTVASQAYGWGHHRGGWGGSAFRGSIWLGPMWWPPVYPYYEAPRVIIPQQPQVYIEPRQTQPEEQEYWYYCPKSAGYYPYVNKCPDGWLKVVPTPTPPDAKE